MLEENVVSAAGAPHRFTYKSIQEAIKEAGFIPQLRNQQYEDRVIPAEIEETAITAIARVGYHHIEKRSLKKRTPTIEFYSWSTKKQKRH